MQNAEEKGPKLVPSGFSAGNTTRTTTTTSGGNISEGRDRVNDSGNNTGTSANDRHDYRFDIIPESLKDLPQWGVWRREYMDGKPNNVPYDAKTGNNLSVNDPGTWSPFAVALEAYQRGIRGQWDGLSVVLKEGGGVVGIDLDDCVDEGGDFTPEAQEIITLWDSYVEYSPSRRGIRGFAYGTMPAGKRRNGKFEMYSTAKVLTVTGWHVQGTPTTIEERTEAIAEIHKRFIAKGTKPQSTRTSPVDDDQEPLEDEEVIALMLQAKNGNRIQALIDGDLAGYASPSEADLAVCNHLAFWCGRDSHEQIDRIFRERFLFFRPEKWDARHYGDGTTYGQHTIKMALDGRTQFYTRPLQWRPSQHEEETTESDAPDDISNEEPNEADEAEEPQEAEEPEEPDDAPRDARRHFFHLTDLGNGERLVARYGDNLLWCNPWRKWLAWDSTRWRIDQMQQVEKWARATVRALYRECSALVQRIKKETDKKKRKALIKQNDALLKHAVNSENKTRQAAMVTLAQMDVPVLPEQLDADLWLLNVQNGTLDLRTGELRPHTRADLLTKCIPIDYDPDASCPQWEQFLASIMTGKNEIQDNNDMIDFLWKALGYSLTGDVREDCLFLLYGTGHNGKTTLIETLGGVLGDYGTTTAFATFLHQDRETVRNDLAALKGARFVSAAEADQGKRLSEALIKRVTGKDTMTARFLFQEYFQFKPQLKLWLAANYKPVIKGTDDGIWRRIRLIPFTQKFDGAKDDKSLGDKLKAERQGILAWMVRGCLAWQADGLPLPETIAKATGAYRTEQDELGAFLKECCELRADLRVKAGLLYNAYVTWSGDKNLTQNAFGRMLTDRGIDREGKGGTIWRVGIALQPDWNE